MKKIFFLISIFLSLSSFCQDGNPECPCVGNEDKSNNFIGCVHEVDVNYEMNGYSGDIIHPIVIEFIQTYPLNIDKSFSICYLEALYDGGVKFVWFQNSFLEAKNYFAEFLEKNIEENIWYSTGLTISEDGKFIIPYCYGEDKLFIYKYNAAGAREEGFPEFKDIEFYKEINLGEGIEAVKFFEKYLIVITKSKIIAFLSNGPKKFRKVAECLYPHSLYKIPHAVNSAEDRMPIQKFCIEMDGDYLYILNAPGNEYGPVLTYKIEGGEIKMINNGEGFPMEKGDGDVRGNVQVNEVYGKKYLTYIEGDFSDDYGRFAYLYLYRLEGGVPVYINRYEIEVMGGSWYIDYTWFFSYSFKNEYIYVRFPDGELNPCSSLVLKFNPDETFSGYSAVGGLSDFQNPDTMMVSSDSVFLSCGRDDLPSVEIILAPPDGSEVAGNLLVMGRAYDSEGIRRVAGKFVIRRGEIFPQEDGSVIFMIRVPVRYHPAYETEFPMEIWAEDKDGDTNIFFNEEIWDEFPVYKTKPIDENPLPIGEVEICPFEYTKNIYINGWAIDNNGIRQGWLFSEDANLLIPIRYGIERQDIYERYPEYPDSLHSGFEISYDLSNLEEGEYEFYIRIMAEDFQVIDFGPYKITIPAHKRPF